MGDLLMGKKKLIRRINDALFVTDFDETMIEQSSMKTLTFHAVKHHRSEIDWAMFKNICKAAWRHYKESRLPFIIKDPMQSMHLKIKAAQNVPYVWYNEIVPNLTLNPVFLYAFSEIRKIVVDSGATNDEADNTNEDNNPGENKKIEIIDTTLEDVIIISRNGEQEINAFLDYKREQPFDEKRLKKYEKRHPGIEYVTEKLREMGTGVANREICSAFGMDFLLIGNHFSADEERYLGTVEAGSENLKVFGAIVNKHNKNHLYRARIAFVDKEEIRDKNVSACAGVLMNTQWPKRKKLDAKIKEAKEFYDDHKKK